MLSALPIALSVLGGIFYYAALCFSRPLKRNGQPRLGIRIVKAVRGRYVRR